MEKQVNAPFETLLGKEEAKHRVSTRHI